MELLKWPLMLLFYALFYLGFHLLVHRTMSWQVVGAALMNGLIFLAISALFNRWGPRRRQRS